MKQRKTAKQRKTSYPYKQGGLYECALCDYESGNIDDLYTPRCACAARCDGDCLDVPGPCESCADHVEE